MKKILVLFLLLSSCSKDKNAVTDDWIGFWSGNLNNSVYFLDITKTKNESSYEIEGVSKIFGTAEVDKTNNTLTIKKKSFSIELYPTLNPTLNKTQIKLDEVLFTRN